VDIISTLSAIIYNSCLKLFYVNKKNMYVYLMFYNRHNLIILFILLTVWLFMSKYDFFKLTMYKFKHVVCQLYLDSTNLLHSPRNSKTTCYVCNQCRYLVLPHVVYMVHWKLIIFLTYYVHLFWFWSTCMNRSCKILHVHHWYVNTYMYMYIIYQTRV